MTSFTRYSQNKEEGIFHLRFVAQKQMQFKKMKFSENVPANNCIQKPAIDVKFCKFTLMHKKNFNVVMWFLIGEVSTSSGCLRWATLFYCGTP